jgi:hypothetical protein
MYVKRPRRRRQTGGRDPAPRTVWAGIVSGNTMLSVRPRDILGDRPFTEHTSG